VCSAPKNTEKQYALTPMNRVDFEMFQLSGYSEILFILKDLTKLTDVTLNFYFVFFIS
jgi:hypothetical protein